MYLHIVMRYIPLILKKEMIRWLTNVTRYIIYKLSLFFVFNYLFKHEIITNFAIEFRKAFFLNFSYVIKLNSWKKIQLPDVNVIDCGTMTRYIKCEEIMTALQIKFANALLNCNGTCAHDSCLHLQPGLKYSRARIFFSFLS